MKLSVFKRAQEYLEGIKKDPMKYLDDADIEDTQNTIIRAGVLDLLAQCGIKPELVAAFPDSDGKKEILAILG